MAGEWATATIEEIAEKLGMGPFGSSIKVETFVPSGVPVISGQHLHGFKLDETPGFNFITPEHAERLRNANVQKGDIILTHAGNIGQVAYVPENSQYDRYVISQRQFYMRCNRQRVIPEFIVYYFRTPEGRHRLLANTSQVGVPSIAQPVSYLRTIQILLPPLPEQRAIAHVLGTLDDKIELLRRMNETLEAMARAIFKAWFVDFEPVRAKAEGRAPDLPREIADLFPDSFQDSELGPIPQGWVVTTLGKHSQVERGVSYAGSELSQHGMPLHNLNSIYEGGGYKYEGIKYYVGDFADRHKVSPGDVIVANTEQGHERLLIGHAALVPRVFGAHGVISHHIYRLRPRHDSPLRPSFLCYLLNTPQMHDIVSGYATGTTVNMLPVDGVQKPSFILPPARLVDAFDDLAGAIQARQEEMVVESRTLAALRDALLPKLISGELRVRDAERIIDRQI